MMYGVCHVYGKSACVVDASRTSKLIISTDQRVKAVLDDDDDDDDDDDVVVDDDVVDDNNDDDDDDFCLFVCVITDSSCQNWKRKGQTDFLSKSVKFEYLNNV